MNILFIAVTLDTSHCEMSLLNAVEPLNIPCMSVTLDTSHSTISSSKNVAPMKMEFISVTPETCHSPIGPCGPSEQSPSGDNFRQVVTALWSSILVCGENSLVSHTDDDTDPVEPSNKNGWIHEDPQCSCLNDFAPMNILSILSTFDTSHSAMSPLNFDARENM